jgi:hypothetical protein
MTSMANEVTRGNFKLQVARPPATNSILIKAPAQAQVSFFFPFTPYSYSGQNSQDQIFNMYQTSLLLALQVAFASIVSAAPVQAQSNSWQYGTGGGIIGFIVLILDIIVIRKSLCALHSPLGIV